MNITATYDEAMVKAMIAEAVAKERNSWPAEMEAMERQVNILTDALAQSRNATLDEIADKIAAMPFGDTAASFAVWIREQKT